MSGGSVLLVDRGDLAVKGCDGPPSRFDSGVRGIGEVGGNGDRIHRNCHVTIRVAPVGETPPGGRLCLVGSLRP